MARAYLKVGDVFVIAIDAGKKKYFQYICNDQTQLNSDVVRGFNKVYNADESPKIEDIVKDTVAFYAHCVVKLGIKMNLWQKAGNTSNIGKIDDILFRGTRDYGRKVGEEPTKVSTNWYVWKINSDFKDVGRLEGENKFAEIGLVVNPNDIVDRITTGKYKFSYPHYEWVS